MVAPVNPWVDDPRVEPFAVPADPLGRHAVGVVGTLCCLPQAPKIAPEAVEAGASGAALRGAEKDSDHVESEHSRTTMGAQFTED